jgi:hypothetical protein
MNKPLRIILIALMAVFLAGSVTSTATAKPFKKTALFNLTYVPQVKPSRVFLTANSGPYLKKIKWSKWGTNRTVGRGRFISDCASCGEKENKPMTLTLYKLRPCPKYHVMAYKKGYLKIKDPEDPSRGTSLPLGCPPK